MKRNYPTEMISALTEGTKVVDNLSLVAEEYLGEWRWGSEHRIIVLDDVDATHWAFDYRLSSGDGEWAWEDDEADEVECYQVEPKPVTTVVYERIGGSK